MKHNNLYHISTKNHHNKVFIPRVPDNTMLGEDIYTKRICFSTSIQGCMKAIEPTATYYFVHVPMGDNVKAYEPTDFEVPDVNSTHEKWIKSQTLMKCIGLIENYGYDKNRALYKWKWIQRFC